MNDSRHAPFPHSRLAVALLSVLSVAILSAGQARAQSQDVSFPTPATTNEVSGAIAARDIGDARLTRHFYLLAGTPGDLIITVTSNNLNGDVDLFTAGSLRPLGKISIYAGARASSATRTIFLRQRESLILRVEARSANDSEGTYSIRFEGTFEPVSSAPTPPEVSPAGQNPTATERTEKSVRRVTSTGARIDEPEPEPTPSAETTAENTAPVPTESRTETTGSATPPEPAANPEPVRRRRPRKPARRRTRVTPQPTPTPRETTAAETPSTQASPAEPALNPRLIIETRDGMRTERFMSSVRSVTVRNGQIVIVSSDGKTERFSLATVLRMSIEP
ncbi:MAG TPA: hypothetical protein VE842_13110 [Pyrinomonadaceae bacterium]|nr:hypothetical protein [Pyrinomonadaceae bacterium]